MTIRYLLDTNSLSERVRPVPNEGLVRRMSQHELEMAMAAPVWHELNYGCRLLSPSRRRKGFEDYLYEVLRPTIPILPYDAAAAEWHAVERARLRRLGRTPPFIDGQIAAIARVNDLVVVTTNVKDYKAFEGIQLEDWRS